MAHDDSLKPALVTSGVILLLMAALAGWAWPQVPEGVKIPVHWGPGGTPDRFGGKLEGLFLMPVIALLTTVIFSLLPRLEPRKQNLLRSRKAYFAIWVSLMGIFAVLHGISILAALGRNVNMAVLVPMVVGALFMVVGNYMGKVRSNFLMGIRTPWTLSSELSWNKTHRLGGRLFVAFGAILVLAAVVAPPELMRGIILVGVAIAAGIPIVYSYLVWRSDPHKQTLGRS
jgi:uncharacterized membrane protein